MELTAHAEKAFRKGDFDDAEKLCRQALAADPDLPIANMMLGNLSARQGLWVKAEACFRKVVELEPNAYEPLEWLANIAREAGRTEEATNLAQRLISMRPNNPGAFLSMA